MNMSEAARQMSEHEKLIAEWSTEPLKKKECKGLVDQLVRMDAQLHGCYADALALNDGHEWQVSRVIKLRIEDSASTALRDLLAPTVELLRGLVSKHNSSMRSAVEENSTDGFVLFAADYLATCNELSRLTALMEGKV